MLLAAPYPAIEVQSVLPSPEFDDTEAHTAEVQFRRSMNGVQRTYIKRKTRQRLQMQFLISRMKALELLAFVKRFYADRIKITDHLNQVWVGFLINNPLELQTTLRSLNSPGGETVEVKLEFEAIKQ